MAIQSQSQLRRLRNSFRHGVRQTTRNLQEFSQAVRDETSLKQVRAKLRKVPYWLKIVRKIYHKYGLKHFLLILVFVLYQFLGAGVFLLLEEKAEDVSEANWLDERKKNKTDLVNTLMSTLFNNTHYLFFLTHEQTAEVNLSLQYLLGNYTENYRHMTDRKLQWDFWNAMLYAGTVCTTIGYGHLFTKTVPGRIATMVYAIFGIPLVFTILDDLGKLLTLGLKYPWLWCKMLIRRLFRHCTGQTMTEIKRIDEEDRKWLSVFDLPIPVAIGVVVAWIFLCSALFCIWEKQWNYFTAFYFFFVSLTTIGLGDIVPDKPTYLLLCFILIIIGLSLVSMCVNLIQAKLERTYEAGREEADLTDAATDVESVTTNRRVRSPLPRQSAIAALAMTAAHRVSLGVLRASNASSYSLSSVATNKSPTRPWSKRQTSNKVCQTLLSIASPKFLLDEDDDEEEAAIISRERHHLVPTSISLDDVMKLVDTEEADLYILSQLCGDRSEANLVQTIDNGVPDHDGFMEDDWHALLLPATSDHDGDQDAYIDRPHRVSVQRQASTSSRVHFKSSVSLIPPNSADQLTSFAGHVAALAQMDTSSLRTPESPEIGPIPECAFIDQNPGDQDENERSPLTKRGPECTSSVGARKKRLHLPLTTARKSVDTKRKTSLIDMLKKRFSSFEPSEHAATTSKHKNRGNAHNRTSIEEAIERLSDDETDDNDRTPLEPKAP